MRKTFLIGISAALFTGFLFGRSTATVPLVETANASESKRSDTAPFVEDRLTPKELIKYMKELNIQYIETTFAQTQVESGNYSSDIFIDNSNIFGMKQAYQRPTTCIKTNRNHAFYKNWRLSVIDFAIYQARVLAKTKNLQEYREYLAKNYAEDKDYLKKLDEKIKENRECGIF